MNNGEHVIFNTGYFSLCSYPRHVVCMRVLPRWRTPDCMGTRSLPFRSLARRSQGDPGEPRGARGARRLLKGAQEEPVGPRERLQEPGGRGSGRPHLSRDRPDRGAFAHIYQVLMHLRGGPRYLYAGGVVQDFPCHPNNQIQFLAG